MERCMCGGRVREEWRVKEGKREKGREKTGEEPNEGERFASSVKRKEMSGGDLVPMNKERRQHEEKPQLPTQLNQPHHTDAATTTITTPTSPPPP